MKTMKDGLGESGMIINNPKSSVPLKTTKCVTMLDYNLYQKLLSEKKDSSYNSKWYDKTYDIFCKHGYVKSIKELHVLIAFAYSWMPTVPEIHIDKIEDQNKLISELQKLHEDDVSVLPELVLQLTPYINNSIVGTSKVLHFVAPNIVPVIDSRVVVGWHKFFNKHPVGNYSKALPKNSNSLKPDHFISYQSKMKEWADNIKMHLVDKNALRELEIKLYLLGKTK